MELLTTSIDLHFLVSTLRFLFHDVPTIPFHEPGEVEGGNMGSTNKNIPESTEPTESDVENQKIKDKMEMLMPTGLTKISLPSTLSPIASTDEDGEKFRKCLAKYGIQQESTSQDKESKCLQTDKETDRMLSLPLTPAKPTTPATPAAPPPSPSPYCKSISPLSQSRGRVTLPPGLSPMCPDNDDGQKFRKCLAKYGITEYEKNEDSGDIKSLIYMATPQI